MIVDIVWRILVLGLWRYCYWDYINVVYRVGFNVEVIVGVFVDDNCMYLFGGI